MKKFLSKLKSAAIDVSPIVNKAFDRVIKESGSVLDSDTAQEIKRQTLIAMKSASSIARNIGDVNGDGKIDKEDLKLAAKKAGIVWDKIDPDLREALIIGGVAGVGINAIPVFGQLVAGPAFLMGTALFYVRAKISSLAGKR
jgi:hypothetical protein